MKIYNGIPNVLDIQKQSPKFPEIALFESVSNCRLCVSSIVRFKYQGRYYLRHHVETLHKHIDRISHHEIANLIEQLTTKCYGTIVKGIASKYDILDNTQDVESTRYVNLILTNNAKNHTGLAALSNTPNT